MSWPVMVKPAVADVKETQWPVMVRRSDALRPQDHGHASFGWRRTTSREPVTASNAITYLAVWCCIHAIADPLAWLPIQVVRHDLNTKRRDRLRRSRLHEMLNKRPNPEMTAYQWRHAVLYHLKLWGNHYSEIERDQAGRPVAMWPLEPWRVEPRREDTGTHELFSEGELYYRVHNRMGGWVDVAAADIFHLRGASVNGIMAINPTAVGAEAIGVGLAMDKYAAAFFGNGASLNGVVSHPGKLSKEARAKLKSAWDLAYGGGASNAFRTAVLDEGMKFDPVAVDPRNAQMAEQRAAQIIDACRLFKVPPHKAYQLERASFNNADQQERIFVRDTLMPIAAQFCQEVDTKLVDSRLGANITQGIVVETKFDFRELLRGDYKELIESLDKAARMGVLSINEIRDELGYDPLDDDIGDMRFVQLNQATLDQMAAIAKREQDGVDDDSPGLRVVNNAR